MPSPAPLTIHTLSTGLHELRAGDAPWGMLAPHAVADLTPESLCGLPPSPRLVVRAARPEAGPIDAESALAAWSRAAWESFDASITRLLAAADRPLVLWTNAGGMLSDAVSTLSFARRQPALRLMVDPVAWLTPAMRKDADDHLARFAQALTLCESIEAVVVRPVLEDPDAAETALRPLIEKSRAVLHLPTGAA